MAKTIKDTDYLVISARVKALETGLLTAERMEQILDAKSGAWEPGFGRGLRLPRRRLPRPGLQGF